jgi:hypothetical protein
MANSFASLSAAFAWGSVILAIVALFGGIAWGRLVTVKAEREARTIAEACTRDYIEKWLAEKAPELVRQRVDLLLDTTLGSGNDLSAADEIGKGAG